MSCAFSVFRLTFGWLNAVAEHARTTVPLAFAWVTVAGRRRQAAPGQHVARFDELVEVCDDVVANGDRVVYRLLLSSGPHGTEVAANCAPTAGSAGFTE